MVRNLLTEFSTPQIFPVTKFGSGQTAGRLKSVTAEIVSNLLAYTVETVIGGEEFITNAAETIIGG